MSAEQQEKRPDGLIALLAFAISAGCLGGGFALLIEPLRPAGALLLSAMFAAWMAWAARGAGWRRMAITGVLVFASLVGIEMMVFLPDLRRVGFGVLLAVLCACVALWVRDEPPARRVSVMSALVLGSVGLLTVVDVRTALVGTLLLFIAAGITIYLILGRWVRRHAGRARRGAAACALAAAVFVPVGAMALIANDVRNGGAYARRYGTLTSVNVGDPCKYTVYFGGGQPVRRSALTCPALWEANGGYQTGLIYGSFDELNPGRQGEPAYVLGDRAWHPSLTRDSGLTLLAHVLPPWLVAVLVVGLASGSLIVITSTLAKPALPPVVDPF